MMLLGMATDLFDFAFFPLFIFAFSEVYNYYIMPIHENCGFSHHSLLKHKLYIHSNL
jgi:hypothetical protein